MAGGYSYVCLYERLRKSGRISSFVVGRAGSEYGPSVAVIFTWGKEPVQLKTGNAFKDCTVLLKDAENQNVFLVLACSGETLGDDCGKMGRRFGSCCQKVYMGKQGGLFCMDRSEQKNPTHRYLRGHGLSLSWANPGGNQIRP